MSHRYRSHSGTRVLRPHTVQLPEGHAIYLRKTPSRSPERGILVARLWPALPEQRVGGVGAAARPSDGITAEYVSIVNATLECPSRSDTTFGWTSAASSCVAWACRRSWNASAAARVPG
jgi:hypothetical protein